VEPRDESVEALELAVAALQRQLGELGHGHRELADTVAGVQAKILAAPSPLPKTWNWVMLNDEEQARTLIELRRWMGLVLPRYPLVVHKMRPCWVHHDYAIDALSAAYGTWHLAMFGKANAELFGHWLSKWLPELVKQLGESLGACTPRKHVPDEVELEMLG
jgi:hypothetical protein